MSLEQHKGSVCLKSDVWSFGCILLELATGQKVFNGLNEFSLCYKMSKGISPLIYAMNNASYNTALIQANPALKELIEWCLTFEYEKRPSSHDIYVDKFFYGFTTSHKKTATIKNFELSSNLNSSIGDLTRRTQNGGNPLDPHTSQPSATTPSRLKSKSITKGN